MMRIMRNSNYPRYRKAGNFVKKIPSMLIIGALAACGPEVAYGPVIIHPVDQGKISYQDANQVRFMRLINLRGVPVGLYVISPDTKFIKVDMDYHGNPIFCGEALYNGGRMRACFGFRGNEIIIGDGTIKEGRRVVPQDTLEYSVIK